MVWSLAVALLLGQQLPAAQASTSEYEPIIRAYHQDRLPNPDATRYHGFRYVGVRPSYRRRVETDMICVSYTMRAWFVGDVDMLSAIWIRDGRVLETIEGVPATTVCATV